VRWDLLVSLVNSYLVTVVIAGAGAWQILSVRSHHLPEQGFLFELEECPFPEAFE